jgi:hypothetical protein
MIKNILASVKKCWGPKTPMKDLGPDILNLFSDPENTDPWEDEVGHHFPNWTMSLIPPNWLGTSSLTLRCYCLWVHRWS